MHTILRNGKNVKDLLRNWKKEFLANAFLAFDNKREDNLREKLAEERKEKAEYAKKVGQLTMQVDWLKKNLKKLSDLTTRVNLVRNLSTTKALTICIRIILFGEPVRCLLNLNCADIRLVDRCKAGKSLSVFNS